MLANGELSRLSERVQFDGHANTSASAQEAEVGLLLGPVHIPCDGCAG